MVEAEGSDGGCRKIAGDGEGQGPKPTGGRGLLVFAALIYFYTMKAVGGSDDLQEANQNL
jgi:hypothetical protein